MANTSTLNTRIQLRNDNLSAWEKSNVQLIPGEIALGLRENGSYEMRIGEGGKTWNELGS